jgi:hypothetical protein
MGLSGPYPRILADPPAPVAEASGLALNRLAPMKAGYNQMNVKDRREAEVGSFQRKMPRS